MSKWIRLFCLIGLAILSQGCKYLKTREITFYRNPSAVDGNPILVDVVYPATAEERDKIYKEFNSAPGKWFTSDYFTKNSVVKDEKDIPAGEIKTISIAPSKRPKKQIGLLIFAEFGSRSTDSSPQPGQQSVVQLTIESTPPPKKKELIWLDQGYMERIDKPKVTAK